MVGVVKAVRHFGLDTEARREMFRPYAQAAWPTMTVAPPVRAALARIDPDQPVSRIRTMDQVLAESMGNRRFPMQLLGLFSAVSLALAGIGVYGVVSYIVSQRMREIGIRMALGARAVQVMGLVMRRSLIPIAAGLIAGIAASLLASRALAALLYEVQPGDPAVLGAIVALPGTTAIAACLLPARRAAAVDPMVVLKED